MTPEHLVAIAIVVVAVLLLGVAVGLALAAWLHGPHLDYHTSINQPTESPYTHGKRRSKD